MPGLLKPVTINEGKIDSWINENYERINQAIAITTLGSWKMGELLEKEVSKWEKDEISLLYTKMENIFGVSRKWLQQCRMLYRRFPDLPELMKRFKVSVAFFTRVIHYSVSHDQIVEFLEANKNDLSFTTISELMTRFKEWFNYDVITKEVFCAVCHEKLNMSDKDKDWRYVPICNHCWNDITEKVNSYVKLIEELKQQLKEKDMKIKQLENWLGFLDQMIQEKNIDRKV